MTNILVGGDEEQFGRLVNRSLSRIGYTNILAADAAEASRCLNEQIIKSRTVP